MNFHPVENSFDTAKIIVPILIRNYKIKSVLDLGCNTGQWMLSFMLNDVTDVQGVDGDNMNKERVLSKQHFIVHNLTFPLNLQRKFDMVMCLEVAEHIDEKYADTLVDTACQHSDLILWSAATPGQTGWNHVNEQPHEYWIEKFRSRGYSAKILKDTLPAVPHDYYRKNAIEFKKDIMKSQNDEAELALKYFKGRKGTLLDVGANDGKTFSNSFDLIKAGWGAYLLEPGAVGSELIKTHRGNQKVHIFNYGLGEKMEKVKFFESGAHVKGGSDLGLVSTTNEEETERWKKFGVQFRETEIQLVPFDGFYKYNGRPKFNLISLDTEGNDWKILKQIDLKEVGCEFLIIEWNGNPELKNLFSHYCGKFGLNLLSENPENLVYSIKP